jgi:hypothetical protein
MNIELIKKERAKSVFGGCWMYTVKHVESGKIITTHYAPGNLKPYHFGLKND